MMTRISKILLGCILVAVIGGVSSSQAANRTMIFVDAFNGSDYDGCGGSMFAPCKTLKKAIEASSSGLSESQRSYVYVFDGTYGTSGLMSNADCQGSSYPTAILIKDLDYLTIAAFPGNEPVVKPAANEAADILSISVENSNYLVIDNIDSDQRIARFDNWHVCNSENLRVVNSSFYGGGDGVHFNTGISNALIEGNTFRDIGDGDGDEALDLTRGSYAEIDIQDNYFENNYRHITIDPASGQEARNILIRRNTMNGTTDQEGVRINDGGGPVIDIYMENNVIMNSTLQSLYVRAPVSDVIVKHNTFFNSGEEEIRLSDAAESVTLMNNIVYANGSHAAISVMPPFSQGPLALENYNLIYNEGTLTETGLESPVTVFGSDTTLGLDPRFVNMSSGAENLRLMPGSPAVAMGTELRVRDDIEEHMRPNPARSNPDKGAYEMPALSVDDEGPLALKVGAIHNPVAVNDPVNITATIDDTGHGNSSIASATYTLYDQEVGIILSGPSPMAAVGGFDEPIENVTAEITSPDVAGIYELCVYGTDEPGNVGEESCIMLIVYDPSAGFVTGGGWIKSPPDACNSPFCDPNAIGHANFGFVSKYKKGDLQPEGSTQFVFGEGGLIFHSTEYRWLVVNQEGNHAQFIGTGTVNGLAAWNGGPFNFLIHAGDGGLGGLIPDTFSIEIWWEDSDGEHVVYDYGKMQPITGGSIVIHTKAQRANSQEVDRYRFEPHSPADTK